MQNKNMKNKKEDTKKDKAPIIGRVWLESY